MSANPVTTFDLVDANDMTSKGSLRAAYGRSFKPVFNGPGTFSFSASLAAEIAPLIAMRSSGVLITRNERPIWSGGVTNIVRDATAGAMQVTATGWREEFDHRYVRKDEEAALAFVAVEGGSIVQSLITACNAQTDSAGFVRPVRIKPGGFSDTQLRTRAYHVGDNYGTSIQELSTIENGVDFRVDPLTRTLSTVAPTDYVDRTDVAFGWGVAPFNLDNVVETSDGTNIFNRENAVTSGGIVTPADDQDAINEAGVMLEEWISLSDVSDVNIAAAYANAELVVKRRGLITYQLTPKSFGNLPRPYDDFEWGDKAYLSVERDSFLIENQAVRLFAGTINYSDEGDEIVSELEVAMSG
jgi:hypothetical protein